MERFSYKGITFAEGAKPSFADFKSMYSATEAFKSVPHKEREAEMKRVHKQLLTHTEKQSKAVNSGDSKSAAKNEEQKDGDSAGTTGKGK